MILWRSLLANGMKDMSWLTLKPNVAPKTPYSLLIIKTNNTHLKNVTKNASSLGLSASISPWYPRHNAAFWKQDALILYRSNSHTTSTRLQQKRCHQPRSTNAPTWSKKVPISAPSENAKQSRIKLSAKLLRTASNPLLWIKEIVCAAITLKTIWGWWVARTRIFAQTYAWKHKVASYSSWMRQLRVLICTRKIARAMPMPNKPNTCILDQQTVAGGK